jgi:hypothetical protein
MRTRNTSIALLILLVALVATTLPAAAASDNVQPGPASPCYSEDLPSSAYNPYPPRPGYELSKTKIGSIVYVLKYEQNPLLRESDPITCSVQLYSYPYREPTIGTHPITGTNLGLNKLSGEP